jgi:serine/threonine protein kinase
VRFEFEDRSGEYECETLSKLGEGGEGVIYILDDQALAKVYHAKELNRRRQEKVLALCARYNHFAGVFGAARFAWPEAPAISADIHEIVGFRMAHLGAYPSLEQVRYDSSERQFRTAGGERLDDDKAIAVAYSLFDALERLHTARIVLGDLNPTNVLVDVHSANALIVDIDSCHVEGFPCPVFKAEYLDPMTEAAGKQSDGSLNYSSSSDYYAAAVMTYELIVGSLPSFFRSEQGLGALDLKAKGVSLLAHVEDPTFLSSHGVRLRSHPLNDGLCRRLQEVKLLDGGRLYRYWHDVLVKGRRYSLLERLPVSDPRNPTHRLLAKKGSRTVVDVIRDGQSPRAVVPLQADPIFFQEEDVQTIVGLTRRSSRLRATFDGVDPIGFQLFVENLGFDYRALLERGTG